jgi:hypothetical protein
VHGFDRATRLAGRSEVSGYAAIGRNSAGLERVTDQELKELVAFYKSPLGQKMLKEEPLALEAGLEEGAGLVAGLLRGGACAHPDRNGEKGSPVVTIAPHDVDLFVISAGSGGRTGERRSMRAGHQGSQCLTIAKAPVRSQFRHIHDVTCRGRARRVTAYRL